MIEHLEEAKESDLLDIIKNAIACFPTHNSINERACLFFSLLATDPGSHPPLSHEFDFWASSKAFRNLWLFGFLFAIMSVQRSEVC